MSGLFICALLASSSLAATLPSPTPDQLTWSEWELGAIIHFNMATYLSGDGCAFPGSGVPSPSLFDPTKINTDQWAEAFKAFGARYAVLVVKHNCGFTLWPSNVTIPGVNIPYNYSVRQSPSPSSDVVRAFVDSCRKAGVMPGFYYSVVHNYFLNVGAGKKVLNKLMPGMVNVTMEQYYEVVLAQLTELWTQYGQLAEVWFDGGYQADLKANLSAMISKMQPHATAFNGYGLSPNCIRWIGTEAGRAPDPNWSTGTSGGGDPSSTVWCPAECDTTLQDNDHWFYSSTEGIRSLDELIGVYHSTVGHNGNLLLDFTPDKDGLIPDDHMKRYQELGDFIRQCYGKPVKSTNGSGTTYAIELNPPATIDRVVLEEDQTHGQTVRAYSVQLQPAANAAPVMAINGSSIGNKKIVLLPAAASYSKVMLSITSSVATPVIRHFGVYQCSSSY
ncbi:uncharacterized protein [Oscarella lobularis]|uniref:uncharacterized protein isoform X1 n=1 Tax=Oscarella lobularis TaxID=121494 RepID=UPI003313D47C